MIRRSSKPAEYFAETAIGAVVLVAISSSLPVLVGGLALIGIAKLVSSSRSTHTE